MKLFLTLTVIFIVVNSVMVIPYTPFTIKNAIAQSNNSGIGDNTRIDPQSGASSLSSLFDPSNIRILSSNNTGYEAITTLDNGLIWHISMNSLPHIQYTPTQKDIERIRTTGEPLYNVNIKKNIANNAISVETSFFVPYNLIRSNTLTNHKISHESDGRESQSDETNNGNEGPIGTANDVRGNVEGVIGIIHEYAEAVKSPILELPIVKSLFEQYDFWWDSWFSNFLDAGFLIIGEWNPVLEEIKKMEDCVKNSPVKFPSEDAKKIWENAMQAAKYEITATFVTKAIVAILAKIPENKLIEIAITKYADNVFKDAIDYEVSNMKKLSPCEKPVSVQKKEEFWNCMQLMKKNLKTFAINSCMNKEGTTPPLKQFTK